MLPIGLGMLCAAGAAHGPASAGCRAASGFPSILAGPGSQAEDKAGRLAGAPGDAAKGGRVRIDGGAFPDAVFRSVVRRFSRDGETLSPAELASVTLLDVSHQGIADLTGIALFSELTQLYCQGNRLAALDVSGNPRLRELDCSENRLAALTLGGRSALRYLYCFDTRLVSLDVSGCRGLRYLYCDRNRLAFLDVSGCPGLAELSCFENRLTALDVSGHGMLTELFCFENNLTSLRVEGCPRLQKLDCSSNCLPCLDTSCCPHVLLLQCEGNECPVSVDGGGKVDLSRLPQPFDPARASAWTGGAVSGSLLTVESGAARVSFTYRVGADEDSQRRFCLRPE